MIKIEPRNIIAYFAYLTWATKEVNIIIVKEEKRIISILYNKSNKTDIDFYNKCEDLIIKSKITNQHNGFTSGFKAGFEFAKSLNSFLEK